ncbi:MAG: UDP-N-acetylenolpyruvoylglucosamine reductase, partial [Patescibacteria group bacterium]
KGFFCAGCVFKNYPTSLRYAGQVESSGVRIPDEFIRNGKIPAGWLIERAGMKGTKIGNAQVSDKHGNFIVNLGGATAREVLDLIAVVKEKVYNKFGIELKEEIQIIQ